MLKKHINKSLSAGLSIVTDDSIKTIGLLIDEIHFFDKDQLINDIKKYTDNQVKVNVLVYRKKIQKNEMFDHSFFTKNDITFSGFIKKGDIDNFISFPFCLLINYYDESNSDLEFVSVMSQAKFKVGFASIINNLNNFIVYTSIKKHNEFTKIMFDYLKILKKI